MCIDEGMCAWGAVGRDSVWEASACSLVSYWHFVGDAGSEQGTWEEGLPWLLWRHSHGRRDAPWVSAGKSNHRVGLVWAPLLCRAVTSQEEQLQGREASSCPGLPGLLHT